MCVDKTWKVEDICKSDISKEIEKIILKDGVVYDVLNSPLAKSLVSWQMIKNDLIFSAECFKLAIQDESNDIMVCYNNSPREDSDIRIEALIKAAVISYARCFVSSEGRRARLNIDTYKEERFKKIHLAIMSERHNFHAHSGTTRSRRTFVLISTDGENRIFTIDLAISAYGNESLKEFISTINIAVEHADSKMEKIKNRLHKDIKK